MNKQQKHTEDRQKNIQTMFLAIAVTVTAITAGVFVFLRFYNSYIDGILYQERLSQMYEVTNQLFKGLEDVVEGQWKDVDAFCNYVETGKPGDDATLLAFMKKQAGLNNMETNGEALVAVDNMGRYMTQDGWQGTLEEMDYLLDQPEKLSFVSKSMLADESRMYFLKRLPEPVEIEESGRKIQIIYYGISQNMSYLNPYFSCSAYDNSNSVYVLNSSGMRLFSSNDNELIKGYNAYNVLQKMAYLHDNSFEEAKAELGKKGYGYANAIMNDEEYYYALYQMNDAEWTLLFLVPSRYVATSVITLINTTIRLILIFAIALVIIVTMIIFFILQVQKKKAIDVERHNSEQLSEALDAAERAEQRATEANRAKTDFLANMSHDIRTPMNAIVGITKLMAHDRNNPVKIDSYIHKVQQSSQHLLSLINDVLDMSKIESGEVTLNKEQISLSDQVEQVESIVRPQIEERSQQFGVYIHNISHEHLTGDAVRLRQVFINLLSNAIKYTPNGGSIRLDLEELPCSIPDHALLRIVVTDSGYGMTPEFLEHIFEPFTRAENSTTNRVQGTGLGMAITKKIVDLSGGTISVQSEVNKGSCFTIEIPFLIDFEAKTEIPVSSALLIADDQTLIGNVQAALSETGINLMIAESEAKTDEILQSNKPDIILLSGHLNGRKLADNLRRLREKTGDALLFCCCDYEEREQIGALSEQGGVDGVLHRPFFLSDLVRAVERTHSMLQEEKEESGSVLNGMRFLCAEDNALNAEILQAVLDMNGASCVIYPDGQKIVDAFATVKPGDFDAVLMDVQMPVMNGLDAAREIRRSENPLGKTILIIAMTANAFSEDVQNCLNAGMDAHVSKPLDIAALERTIKSFANGKFSGGGDNCPSAIDKYKISL